MTNSTDRHPARTGRPPAGADARTRSIAVAVSPAEWARWRAAADAAGTAQLARWVRDVVTAAVAGGHGHRVDVSELRQLKLALTRVGTNVNQIARAMNAAARGGPVGPSHRDIEAALAEARWEIQMARAALTEIRER